MIEKRKTQAFLESGSSTLGLLDLLTLSIKVATYLFAESTEAVSLLQGGPCLLSGLELLSVGLMTSLT